MIGFGNQQERAACRCCVHRASPPWTSHARRIPLPALSLPGLIARPGPNGWWRLPAATLLAVLIQCGRSGNFSVSSPTTRRSVQGFLLGRSQGGPQSWGSDAEFLGARTAEALGTVQVAIELLHLLQHLPVLERLCPLPGTARAAASSAIGDADTRILGKIRALLAKAESTEFPEEAEALSARAQELMAKHSIDHALLAAQSGNRDKPAGRRLPVDNPYESPKATLLHAVAQANRCRSVWQKALGISTVIGFPSDLDAVELLFTSLLVQANTAMLREGTKRDAYGRSRTRAFRQSFLVAYALRIGERLSQATVHAEQEAVATSSGQDLLPVLNVRHRAVDDAVDEMFGDGLVYDRAARVSDEEGWYSGLAAADMAALHGREQVTA